MEKEIDSKKIDCKAHYQSLIDVYCPVLKCRVKFNADGFYHMIFKTSRKKRTHKEQFARLALIPLIKPVIRNAKKIDETRVEDKIMSANGQKITMYHSLISRVGKRAVPIKVVVRKDGNGAYFFHSVMRLSNNTKSTE